MKQEQIKLWAIEAGFHHFYWEQTHHIGILHRFASLVAGHEREQCAEACNAISEDRWAAYKNRPPYVGKETTRYSQHTEGESDGADLCAAAIRERSKA